jgi:hypothetical protein
MSLAGGTFDYYGNASESIWPNLTTQIPAEFAMLARLLFAMVLAALPHVALAAPIPNDSETPKLRSRLIGTMTLPVRVEDLVWLPDGKHLILRCHDGIARVVRRDQIGENEPTVKAIVEFKLPARCQHLELTAEGNQLYSVVAAEGKLTTESRLHFWNLKQVLAGTAGEKAERVITLENDPVFPIAISADSRQLIAGSTEMQPSGNQSIRFDRLSTKTGDRLSELVNFDETNQVYCHHSLDPKANRLFVYTNGTEDSRMQCLDLANGKSIWDRTFSDRPANGQGGCVTHSPDGRLVAFAYAMMAPHPNTQPGNAPQLIQRFIPTLLNAKTGETMELPVDDIFYTQIHAFSADGRLLVGRSANISGNWQMMVWDTKTGKVLRSWKGFPDGVVAFSPSGYELLAIDREQTVEITTTQIQSTSGNSVSQPVTRTTHKSIVGIWDLAPLVTK